MGTYAPIKTKDHIILNLKTFCKLEYIHMRGEMNSNQYEISFQLKISLWCSVSSLHELRQNETQTSMDFILVILTEMKFQTGMRFPCAQNLPKGK